MNVLLILAAIGTTPCYNCPTYKPVHYSAPAYVAPAYVAPTYEYKPLPDYPNLYTRGYKTAAGGWYTEAGFYVKTADGWQPYSVPQIGKTVYGGSPTQYNLALNLGYQSAVYAKPGVLKQLGDPQPLNAKDFLPDPQEQHAADVEGGTKALTLAIESKRETDRAAIESNKAIKLAQIAAASRIAAFQQIERDQRNLTERAAILLQQSSVSSNGDASSVDLPIADARARAVVISKCYECHGGSKVEAGLDFRLALNSETAVECLDQVLSGEMPKNGNLTPDERSTLKGFFKSEMSKGR